MEEQHKKPFGNYYPLFVIFMFLIIAAIALSLRQERGFLDYFMGLFFVVFSMFKFFDLKGFKSGFIMYDAIAKKQPAYATAYPFIELVLGLLYLSGFYPTLTNLLTIIVMSVSAYGVIKSLNAGMNVRCSCLGTIIDVPLSTISILENIGMGLMALLSLIRM